MSYQLRTLLGGTEAVIDDNCGISKFYAIAHALKEDLKVVFFNRKDNADNHDWDFSYKDQLLTLHYNIFKGVSITAALKNEEAQKQDPAVIEVANHLGKRIF